MGNVVNVYRVKGDKKSGKILELKLHNQSVAAPTAERFADDKKCAGTYAPRTRGAKMRRGIDPELLAWLEKDPRTLTNEARSIFDVAASFAMRCLRVRARRHVPITKAFGSTHEWL